MNKEKLKIKIKKAMSKIKVKTKVIDLHGENTCESVIQIGDEILTSFGPNEEDSENNVRVQARAYLLENPTALKKI